MTREGIKMTNDEAKSVLFNMLGKGIYVKDTKENQAILVALRALEQEPCEDWYDVPSDEMTLGQARQAVKDLRKMWAEHLEQAPCDDAISRQAALDAFGLSEKSRKYGGDHSGYDTIMLYEVQDALEALPPVTPQPKTGHWIELTKLSCAEYSCYVCSECEAYATTSRNDAEKFAYENEFYDYGGNPYIETLDVDESEDENADSN